jgi:hypothetical protein
MKVFTCRSCMVMIIVRSNAKTLSDESSARIPCDIWTLDVWMLWRAPQSLKMAHDFGIELGAFEPSECLKLGSAELHHGVN